MRTQELIDRIRLLNGGLHALAWGPGMLLLLGGTGLFLSLRCGFPQLIHLGRILRETAGSLLRRRVRGEGELSPFQALCTALAGTVGTGNVAGVTGAILLGGPGAVFWMWVAAFFGMATKYAEIALAVRYRVVSARNTAPLPSLSRSPAGWPASASAISLRAARSQPPRRSCSMPSRLRWGLR